MKLLIGSDHGGVELKAELKQSLLQKNNIQLQDVGTNGNGSVDYPDFGIKVASMVSQGEADAGILVCGTGLGMCIVANKFPNVRAAVIYNDMTAEMAKAHNNANIICLGGRTTDTATAKHLVDIWLKTEFEGERHQRRLDKIKELETKWS